ncbi:MAG: hypothetical protein Unbinned3987contig1001_41 [Prokaryotic dsDNA virus sp.]|mgnify:CR=1 FL=1|jgi:hypothetical protein|nr:MAG: hypothetical protein Unbinned3987contig1001_41 [Prokaryotic dsDNA virus sp.]|tara:strand:+ start:144 stop:725 length:582 start_codon:yes stop_codon:yes gene_type:complete
MPGVHNQLNDLPLTQVLTYIQRCGQEDGMKFIFGPITEIDLENLHRDTYPLVYSELTSVNLYSGYTTYTIDITVCDLDDGDIQGVNTAPNKKPLLVEPKGNRTYQLRNLLDFTKRMIGKLKHGGATSEAAQDSVIPVFEYNVVTPINLTPFIASFSNQVIGYNFSLQVETTSGLNAISKDDSDNTTKVIIDNN